MASGGSANCDRPNPNIIARSDDAKNAKRIRIIHNATDQWDFYRGNVSVAPSYCQTTVSFTGTLISCLIYYQVIQHALAGTTSQANNRLVCPIMTNNRIHFRPDVNPSDGKNIPICTKEDADFITKFFTAIMKYLIRLGMNPHDAWMVTVYSLFFGEMSGIGTHADSPTKTDKDLLFLRLLLRYGGAQTVHFSAYSFTEKDEKATNKVPDLSFDLVAEEGFTAYLTTPFSNGKLPLCWQDDDKAVGIQAKHRVSKVARDGKKAVNFVIDFPLDSEAKVEQALEYVRSNEFKLDL